MNTHSLTQMSYRNEDAVSVLGDNSIQSKFFYNCAVMNLPRIRYGSIVNELVNMHTSVKFSFINLIIPEHNNIKAKDQASYE